MRRFDKEVLLLLCILSVFIATSTILAVPLLFDGTAYAQSPDFLWATRAAGPYWDEGNALATDGSGNIIVTGQFAETATFGTTTLTGLGPFPSGDIFIAKYDANGNLLWVRQAGGPGSPAGVNNGRDVATDGSGNVFVTGEFINSTTFETTTLISQGDQPNGFVAKYDADGHLLWAKPIYGQYGVRGTGIAADGSGNCFLTGFFGHHNYGGTASFGTVTLSSVGGADIFIAKYDPDGTCLWAERAGSGTTGTYGGYTTEKGEKIATDSSGNSTVIGHFSGTATFGTIALTSIEESDIFIAKYDPDGNCLWAKQAGGTNEEREYGIAVDGSGNSVITGYFRGTAIFGTTTLTSTGESDVFIAKYDPNGTCLWAKQVGGPHRAGGYGIAVDGSGNSVITGYFRGTAIFETTTLTCIGEGYDIFIAKYNPNGNLLWVKQVGGTDNEGGIGIAADGLGNTITAGYFYGSVTFGTTALTNAGDQDIFIAKMGTSTPPTWPPVLASVGDQTVDEGQMLDVPVSATDPDGTIPALSASNLPVFAGFTDHGDGTATLRLEPDFTHSGTYPDVMIIATDSEDPSLTDSESITITVNDMPDLPPGEYVWGPDTDLSNVSASFWGEDASDRAGRSVSDAGDVNGDGYDDFLIGAIGDDDGGDNAGQVYLMLGKASGWTMDTDLSNADASFIGEDAQDSAGWSVSGVGDVNGDGYDDFLIDAPYNNGGGSSAGQTYLILGKTSGWSMNTDLSNADASFIGEDAGDNAGSYVSGAGDVNGDGYDDFLIGANEDEEGGKQAGQVYLILGKTSGWTMDTDLSQADASFIGEDAQDFAGAVSGVGDVNGDDYDDFLIGANEDEEGGTRAGQAYLILGKVSGWSMDTDLSNADASFIGEDTSDWAGISVSRAGDVNGDGYDDFLIGAFGDEEGGGDGAGQAYLIQGKASGWRMDTDLSAADASFWGEDEGDYAGYSVSGAGDMNGDGYDDFLIGAYGNDEGGTDAGQAYLVLSGQTGSTNIPPELASMGDQAVDEGQMLDVPVSAIDPDRTIPTLSASNLPVFASFVDHGDGTGTLHLEPDFTHSGTYQEVVITATDWEDPSLTDSESITITVNDMPDLPPGEYVWGPDTDLSNASASFWGEDAGDRAGYSVAGVGDVNGDGYDDFLIGAYRDEDGGFDAGQVYLIFGKASGWSMDSDVSQADASFLGEDAGDQAGESVSWAGDVNGDGHDDFLIGARHNDRAGSDAGQVYLIFGKSSEWGMDTDLSSADASFIGEDGSDQAGYGVSHAGDVNGDGYDDFLIGAQGDDDGGSNAGQVYLIFGKPSEWAMDTDLSSADASFIGEDQSDYVGYAASHAGDVNGDGYDDFLISAYRDDDVAFEAGQVYLILGKPSGWHMDTDLSQADASFIGENECDRAGRSVSCAGDVNGDGYDDFVIGASGSGDGGTAAGRAYLILGKPSGWHMDTDLSQADASFWGEDPNDYAGRSVSGAGDVNGDGYDDFLIGAYGNEEGGGDRSGQVYLILGKTSGWVIGTDLSQADASFWGENVRDWAGISVSGAGDVNGDGYDDFLIGAYGNDEGGTDAGQAYLVLSGQTGSTNMPPELASVGDQTVDEGQMLDVPVSATDPDRTIPTLSASNLPVFAGFTDHGDGTGTLRLEPDFTHSGTYPDVMIIATDSEDPSLTDSEPITITVKDVTRPPVAIPDAYDVNEDNTLAVAAPGILSNDSDLDGDPLTAVLVSDVSNGTLTLNTDGSFTYAPDENFNGSDSFTYKANDGKDNSNVATVAITINPVNDAPVAVDEDGTLNMTAPGVLDNDTDVEGNPLTAVSDSDPSNGTLALNADGSFTYTPNADFNGEDSFTYAANDGKLGSSPVTVTITVNPVNDAPVANDDNATTDEDTAAMIPLLVNDTDVDEDVLTVSTITQGSNGTVVNNGDGTVTYTPIPNYNGDESFTYTVSDGNGETDTATVMVIINPVNDPPALAVGDTVVNEGEELRFVVRATDPDEDVLTYSAGNLPAGASFDSTTQVFSWTPDFTQAGVYPGIHFEVTDGELMDSEDIAITVNNVTPEEVTENLIESVESMDLPKGTEGSLTSKLDNGLSALGKGNYTAAINKLGAFINQVEALRGKKLTDEQADELIRAGLKAVDAIQAEEKAAKMAAMLPDRFALFQNHPNPFNPVTTIAYELAEPGDVTLTIYTVTGQQVSTLVSGHQEVGHYEVRWNGNGFGDGIYLCRLEAGRFAQTKRMLLLK